MQFDVQCINDMVYFPDGSLQFFHLLPVPGRFSHTIPFIKLFLNYLRDKAVVEDKQLREV